MEPLYGPIRDYAWGSRTVIAGLQGRSVPSAGPEAELWLGAHPGSPAMVCQQDARISLVELLAAEPGRWLGDEVLARFDGRLPFLMKLLAPEAPLSLQAHPDPDQARTGYAADQDLPPTAHRNYVDPYHKPEVLVAIAPFEALCGFRDPRESAAVLEAFDIPALKPVVACLRTGVAGLRDAVQRLLTWPAVDRAALVETVRSTDLGPEFTEEQELVRRLAGWYPADPGVLVALLLNHVRLEPGSAIWMPAGNLHAYLRGAGVEIMAASDNVLRGGLTPKHVDIAELLRVLRFEVLEDPLLAPAPVAPGVVTWPVPVDDFALYRVRLDDALPEARLTVTGPRVLVGTSGAVTVRDAAGAVTVEPGRAAIGAADGGELVFSGRGEVFVGAAGISDIPGSA
ncbi:mannose-6-phosphate isomerase, class I [Micromonospora sp. NBC_01796]|uniref:mannose-6-phosphate isomerase, class I n=1 Tax=Micromonospora sp. NBC_01796 TaxID=2975987 RepID=UPI002DD9312E|nr:mannose-6-phosphate isomerase, class I [Micromonospora sp. NBC_01796]WSA87530.1 mannose-6-phosphate isomerase, class I [Micromonospora sp. NBC_01796]